MLVRMAVTLESNQIVYTLGIDLLCGLQFHVGKRNLQECGSKETSVSVVSMCVLIFPQESCCPWCWDYLPPGCQGHRQQHMVWNVSAPPPPSMIQRVHKIKFKFWARVWELGDQNTDLTLLTRTMRLEFEHYGSRTCLLNVHTWLLASKTWSIIPKLRWVAPA